MSLRGAPYGAPPGAISPAATAAIAIGLVALAALFAFWLTTGLSALVFEGAWPTVSLTDLLRAAVALPGELGDPAAAWPRRIARELASPGAFYATACALLLGGAGAAVFAAPRAVAFGQTTGLRSARAPAAKWAGRADVRRLVVSAPQRGRVALGRFGRSLLAAEERQSVLVVAPTQSYKTTGIAVPALLEWEGPAIVTSVKADLLEDTLARRRELGDVFVYDPTDSTPVTSAAWTPLGSAGSWFGAQQMAFWLCAMARPPQASQGGDAGDANFWAKAAAKLLGPLLLAAATSGREIADVLRWVETQEEGEVREALEVAGEAEALRAAEASFMREERQRSSIYTTIETVLEAYGDPRVLDSARSAEISPAALLDGGSHTLYVCGPAHEQERLAPVFSALLEEMLAVAYRSATASGRLDPPLLLVGDELANIAPIRSLPTLASTGAGQGIVAISIFQDLAQIQQRWGRSWRTVANGHRAKIFGTGNGDPETLDYVRRLTGDGEYRQRSESSGHGLGHGSRTEATTYRSIAPANVVREAKPGTAVLVYGHLPPARLRLRPFFDDPTLSALAAIDPDEPSTRAPAARAESR